MSGDNLCPICGQVIKLTGETTDGRVIGSCYDAFRAEQYREFAGIHRDTYYKDFGENNSFISGLSIPVDNDGVCRNRLFINCDFHAGCKIPYENCEFINCHNRPHYKGSF